MHRGCAGKEYETDDREECRNAGSSVRITPHGIRKDADDLHFIGILAWEVLCMMLLWRAFCCYSRHASQRWRTVYLTFTALLVLFGMFILGDELFHAYKMEGDHRSIAILLLASLLVLHLLPDRLPET